MANGLASVAATPRVSSVTLKIGMAITGLALGGFVCVHLAGNLLLYLGPTVLNAYARSLHDAHFLLWPARAVLFTCLGVHLTCAFTLQLRNRRAAGRYVRRDYRYASLSSRTMLLTGSVVLFFILYHLAHFTLRITDARFAQLEHTDIYQMLVMSFQSPVVTFFYVLAMLFLGLHLQHAFSSLLQTLGLNGHRYRRVISVGGRMLAWAIMLGNMSLPLSVYLGIVQ